MSTNELEKFCDKRFCTNHDESPSFPSAVHQEKAHELQWTPAERARLEKNVEKARQKMKMRIEQKEKELHELRRRSSSAEAALKLNKDTFTKMIKLMKEKNKSMAHHTRSLQHGAQTGYRVHLDLIKDDIRDLKKEMAHREFLIKTHDAYNFLIKNNALLEMFELPEERCTEHHWMPIRKFILDKNQVPTFVSMMSYLGRGRPTGNTEPRKPRMNSAHLCSVTWDPNTAHRNVSLELNRDGNERAEFKSQPMDYPDHPDRFSDCVQVLSREPLTGRCYFEVRPTGACFIGLTYKSIERKGIGKQSIVGLNDNSWACFGGGYYVPRYPKNETWLLVPNPCSNRMAVYLDYERGVLTFYAVFTESLSVLYHVETKFTEPLYFGAVFMYPGDHVVILDEEDLN